MFTVLRSREFHENKIILDELIRTRFYHKNCAETTFDTKGFSYNGKRYDYIYGTEFRGSPEIVTTSFNNQQYVELTYYILKWFNTYKRWEISYTRILELFKYFGKYSQNN